MRCALPQATIHREVAFLITFRCYLFWGFKRLGKVCCSAPFSSSGSKIYWPGSLASSSSPHFSRQVNTTHRSTLRVSVCLHGLLLLFSHFSTVFYLLHSGLNKGCYLLRALVKIWFRTSSWNIISSSVESFAGKCSFLLLGFLHGSGYSLDVS